MLSFLWMLAFNQAFLFLSVLRGLIPIIWLLDKDILGLFLKWGLKGLIKAYKRPWAFLESVAIDPIHAIRAEVFHFSATSFIISVVNRRDLHTDFYRMLVMAFQVFFQDTKVHA